MVKLFQSGCESFIRGMWLREIVRNSAGKFWNHFGDFNVHEKNYGNRSNVIESVLKYHQKCSKINKYDLGFMGSVLVSLYEKQRVLEKCLESSKGCSGGAWIYRPP
jgi:hypothetical protein